MQFETIVNILKEEKSSEAVRALRELKWDNNEQQFLIDILEDKFIYHPSDKPFTFATEEWSRNVPKLQQRKDLLKRLSESSISDINRAKINDFLWVVCNDYQSAQMALDAYVRYIETSNDFLESFIGINRLISISTRLKSKVVGKEKRAYLVRKVLELYDKEDDGKICSLLETAVDTKVDVAFLISYIEKVLSSYSEDSIDYIIIGNLCDLLEDVYTAKDKIKKEKVAVAPSIIKIRRRKVQAIIAAANSFISDNPGNAFQRVNLLKDAVNLMKRIKGTDSERRELLNTISIIQKDINSKIPMQTYTRDCSHIVKPIMELLERVDKENIICYLAFGIEFPSKKDCEEKVLKSIEENPLSVFFPIGILGKDGQTVAKSKSVLNAQHEIDPEGLQCSVEKRVADIMRYEAQIVIANIRSYLCQNYKVEENDIKSIIENSAFVPEKRRSAFIKGLMAGFQGDLMTALYILVPQIENSVRELARCCGEPLYKINEEKIEEIKPIHMILNSGLLSESLDEDLLLALKVVCCSKFGFNARNELAHGLLDDSYFRSFDALYIWWFAFRLCYMFCGDLQFENRKKLNEKIAALQKDNS